MQIILPLLLLCLFTMPGSAQAAAFFDTDWETASGANDFATHGWNDEGTATSGCFTCITTEHHLTGTHALKLTYDSVILSSQAPYLIKTFLSSTHVFLRFAYKMSPGFQMPWNNAVKIMRLRGCTGCPGGHPVFWAYNFYGDYAIDIELPYDHNDNYTLHTGIVPTRSTDPTVFDQVEMEVKLNDPGVANGLARMWVNGALRVELTGRQFIGPNPNSVNSFGNSPELIVGSTYRLDYLQTFEQNGVGNTYIDRIAAGPERIGLVDGSIIIPNDTTPPTQVTGLAVTPGGSGTWTAISDAAGYNVRRCTGASCTPTAGFTTVTANSFSDSTGVAGTVYGYSVNAFDTAGNQGTYSSPTVYRTAPATFRTILGTDLFNRANGTLGADWDDGYTGLYAFELVSNQLRLATIGVDSLETYNAVATPNNQWCQITLSQVGGAGEYRSPGCILRFANPPTFTGYECRVMLPGTSRIGEWAATIFTEHISTSTWTWAAGDKMRCEVEGTALRMYAIRGAAETLVASATDATLTSGKTGMTHYVSAGTAADVQIDDFLMGEITATPATPAKILTVTNPATRTNASGITYNAETTHIRVSTEFADVVEPVSAFPGGVYTYPASVLNSVTDFIGFFGRNVAGAESTDSADWIYVSVPAAAAIDTDPPIMTLSLPNATIPSGETTALIALTTNKFATCRYAATDIAYSAMTLTMAPASLTHSATVTGLGAGTVNRYARCNYIDTLLVSHPNTSSLTIPITIAAAPVGDTTAPTVPGDLVATALSQSQVELRWSVTTDAGGMAGYQAYSCTTSACSTIALAGLVTPATTIITNNPPSTVTYWCVKAVDTSNNYSACSSTVTVTTSPVLDVEPPSDMTNLRLVATFTNSVQLTSDLMTDNQGAVTSTIELSTTGCAGTFTHVYTNLAQTHFIPNLQPNTTYCARGKGSDSLNVSAAYSNLLPFTTAAAATGALTQPRAPAILPRPSRTP